MSLPLNTYDKFNYNLFDIFLGYGIGGVASTSLIVLIISLIILLFNKYYKRYIVLTSTLSFLLIMFIFIFLGNTNYLNIILNGYVYFAFVFVGADLYNSPNTNKGMLIYGLIIGILSAIFTILFNFYEAPYLSILISSMFIPLLNKLDNNKYLQK